MKQYLPLLLLLACGQLVFGQPGGQPSPYMLDMQGLAYTVLPFYALTMLSGGLFLHYLIRPKSKVYKYVYILSVITLVGALVIGTQLENILTQAYTQALEEGIHHKEAPTEQYDAGSIERITNNFLVISVPNFVFLVLTAALQYRRNKYGFDDKRPSRYS